MPRCVSSCSHPSCCCCYDGYDDDCVEYLALFWGDFGVFAVDGAEVCVSWWLVYFDFVADELLGCGWLGDGEGEEGVDCYALIWKLFHVPPSYF